MTRHHRLATPFVALALSASVVHVTAITAQSPAQGRTTAAPVFESLASLLNAPVLATANPADGVTGTREHLGTVSDLVIDTQGHRITVAAVHTGDGDRAVPVASLSWDANGNAWVLGNRDDLAKAEAFDPQRLDGVHRSLAEATAQKQQGTGEGQGTNAQASAPAGSGRYALATDCAKRTVVASDGRFGSAVGLVIEVRSKELAFLTVAANGGDVAIPWPALQASDALASDQCFSLSLTNERLEAAPRLGKDAASKLSDEAFRARLYQFFAVTPPAFEPATPVAGKK